MSTSTTINPTTGEEHATYDDHTDAGGFGLEEFVNVKSIQVTES